MKNLFNPKSLTIVLGVSLCGVTGYLLYLLFRNDDDDEYLNTVPKVANYKRIEIRIKQDQVRIIIGRNGNKIKQIQDQTNTHISFKDTGDKIDKICVIKGSAEACNMAENLIHSFISKQAVLDSEDIWVPQNSVGKIIGRCGENISEISNITGAKINVSNCDNRSQPIRRVTLKGTKEQIRLAKSYIDETVEKFKQTQSHIESSLAKREPRLPPKSADGPKTPVESPRVERISPIPGQSDTPFEVYVSAMIDPSRFWIQIVGPKATELDLLVEEMTEYYTRAENKETHSMDKVQPGDLVAATFQYDNKWYRAEVLNVVTDELSNPQAELYYVDYGDTDTVSCKELFELRTDFLRLHFQAIECFLAKIEPTGESWSEDAVDKFEEWTHVAQWQKLSAKMNGYCSRDRTRAKREGSPVPGVDLFDVNNDSDVNIAQELVKHGLAVYKKESERSSRATSVSNISVESS